MNFNMATDINAIIANLLSFYNFKDQTIISVGAGGGQFIEYARKARRVYAVDNDKEALSRLSESLAKAGLADKFTLVHSEFEQVSLTGDVVLFEFCLHEMADAEVAIKHALTMAPAVVISDHLPGSEWAYIVGEEQKVTSSRNAIESFNIMMHREYHSFQRFADYNELYQKVKGQGDEVINRISKYVNQTRFEIPMSYGFVLI
jgi:predicted RNA methylase